MFLFLFVSSVVIIILLIYLFVVIPSQERKDWNEFERQIVQRHRIKSLYPDKIHPSKKKNKE